MTLPSKWLSTAALSAAVFLLGLPAYAQLPGTICSPGNDNQYITFPGPPYALNPFQCVGVVSDVPAATLLLPYFEVDLSNPSGKTTIFSINDSSSTAVVAHVTIWSDLSVPVFNFNVYLTGYDTQIINLRDVLNGNLPQTATAGQDPYDTISPRGPWSQDINFASCTGGGGPSPGLFSYPLLPTAHLSANQIANMVASLTGQPSAPNGNLCAGLNHGDNIARGYITIDAVDNCTSRFPSDAGYLGEGDATFQNDLTGEVYYVAGSSVQSSTLVHIVANTGDPATSTPGRYTFYGRYDSWTAIDHLQPLATNFMARYVNTALGAGGTGNNRVESLDPYGNFLSQFGTGGSGQGQFKQSAGIALRADGSIAVLDAGNSRVEVFDASGNFLFQFGSLGTGHGQFMSPTAILARPDKSMLVLDAGNNRIEAFDAFGNFLNQFGTTGSGRGQFNDPSAFVRRSDGSLLVLDSASTASAGVFSGPSLIVWRDSKVAQSYFSCPAATGSPAWYPLSQEGIVAFDEQEHPQAATGNPFPAETQIVPIGGAALPVTFTSGWIWLDLNIPAPPSPSRVRNDLGNPSFDPAAAQAWVMVVDKFGALHPAEQLDSAVVAWHYQYFPRTF